MDVKDAAVEYLREVAPQTSDDDVPPGYKRTEVGVIPEDWGVVALGSVGHWRGGMTPSMNNPLYWKSGSLPWLSSGDIKASYLSSSASSITEYAIRSNATTLMPKGSIVVVMRSGILRKFLPVAMTQKRMAINQDLKAVRPNSEYFPTFLLQILMESGPQILASCLKSGTTVESIEFSWLKSFVIPLPPTKAEQEAIAEALSDTDALIAALQRLIVKKCAIKQCTMQALLTGRQRLPGFTGEWETNRLGDICSMKSGTGITSGRIDNFSMFPCFGGNGLRGYTAGHTHEGTFALVGRQGALCGNVMVARGKFFASEHAIVVTAKFGTYIDWLAIVLARMQLNRLSESSAQPGLSVSKILELECEVPPVGEQTTIATVLSDMDAEIEALESRLTKTRQLKAGMMQQLLTGRIRLPLAEAA